jgi:hypothetical protein
MTTHVELVTAKTVRISTTCPNKRPAGKCGRISKWQPLPDGMHYLVCINGGRGTSGRGL